MTSVAVAALPVTTSVNGDAGICAMCVSRLLDNYLSMAEQERPQKWMDCMWLLLMHSHRMRYWYHDLSFFFRCQKSEAVSFAFVTWILPGMPIESKVDPAGSVWPHGISFCVELLTREYSCRSSSATRGMVRFMYSAVDTIRMLQSHSKPTGSHPMDRYNSHFVSFHTRAIIYENAYFVCCVAFHLTAAAAARIRCSVTEYSHQRKSLCRLCKIYSKWILQHEKYANEWLYHASRAQHSLRKFQFEVYAVSLHCPMMVPNIDRH